MILYVPPAHIQLEIKEQAYWKNTYAKEVQDSSLYRNMIGQPGIQKEKKKKKKAKQANKTVLYKGMRLVIFSNEGLQSCEGRSI